MSRDSLQFKSRLLLRLGLTGRSIIMIMLMEFKFQVAVWSLLVIGRRVKLGADGG